MAAIYLGAIDEFGPIETAVALHHDVARLRERLGQVDKVEALYREILRLKSDDAVALQRIEQICRSEERWEDLANVLEKRTAAPATACPPAPSAGFACASWPASTSERLERPYEAIDTLERLLDGRSSEQRTAGEFTTTPEASDLRRGAGRPRGADPAVLARRPLGRRSSRACRSRPSWSPIGSKARALRLEMATVYEKELSLADRATEAYEAILAELPDDDEALAALDRLQRGPQPLRRPPGDPASAGRRWPRAPSGPTLVRRRARILEDRLNNPEAAASALRELGTEAIADDELMAALLRNLRRAGLAHEAARVLVAADRDRAGPRRQGQETRRTSRASPS